MGFDGEKEESFLLTVIKIQYQSRNEFGSSVYLHQGGKEYEGSRAGCHQFPSIFVNCMSLYLQF